MSRNNALTIDDVLTGIIAVAVESGVRTISSDEERWAYTFEHIMRAIQKEAHTKNLDVHFTIRPEFKEPDRPYPYIQHENKSVPEKKYSSLSVDIALGHAIGNNFLDPVFGHPIYKLTMPTDKAVRYLETAPGGRKMYETLSDRFNDFFEREPVFAR